MKDKARSVLRNIFVLINIAVIFVYLLVCLVPFIDTGKYWFIAFPGLAFPLIFFALLCFVIFWAILKIEMVLGFADSVAFRQSTNFCGFFLSFAAEVFTGEAT